MPKKTKQFINKKEASVYHLVRRSNRDIGGYFDEEGKPLDVPRDFVLMPTPETQQKIDLQKKQQQQEQLYQIPEDSLGADDALARAKQQLKRFNLVDDYDYDKHMMEITGTGAFVGSDGKLGSAENDVRANPVLLEDNIQEMDRQLDSIAITADCMDDDVAQALFDYEEGEFEEILDDFCLTAAQEPEDEEEVHAFDFDAHIEALIQKARMEENGGARVAPTNHDAWNQAMSSFQGVKPFSKHENDAEDAIDFDEDGVYGDLDEYDYQQGEEEVMEMNPGVVPKLRPEEEKALCDKFEQTLLEYDSDDLGDLDEECMDIRGDKPLEGDVNIEAALDQFLQDKKDKNFIIGTRHTEKKCGGGSKVFLNNKLVPFNAIDKVDVEVEETEDVQEVLKEAEEVLANPEMDLPPEEVLIDGKSYFTLKERNPWDCESILSTYSNLDNNPAVIGRNSRRRKKKKNKKQNGLNLDDDITIPEEQPVQILLSNKTGLPLGVLPERGNQEDNPFEEETFVSVNKGEARKKNETKEEKRLRKQAVKEERMIARMQKKMMKEAVAEEFGKRAGNSDDVTGKSVFRYS